MKTREERLQALKEILKESEGAINGENLAKQLNVSRQVIVQYISLLKAENYNIISTNRGYRLIKDSNQNKIIKIVKVHHEDEDLETELNTIVDLGVTIKNVFVWHKAYGKLTVDLNIKSRRDVKNFIETIKSGVSKPLKKLTDNFHYHTLEAESQELIDEAISSIDKLGFLLDNDDMT